MMKSMGKRSNPFESVSPPKKKAVKERKGRSANYKKPQEIKKPSKPAPAKKP